MEKIDNYYLKKTKRWLTFLLFCLIFLTGQMTFAQYCASSSSDADYEWITNVTFAGINNTTGGNTGLNNYTGQTATVDKDLLGQQYTLSVSIEADSNEYLTVFIDWNQNGTLNDPGETYVLASATSGSGPFTIQVTVPAEAVLGSTRMRVILNYGGTPTPCTSPEYGEIEDYTVIVLGTPPACPAPTAFQVTGVTPATASLSWSGTGNFIVEYGLSGFTQGTGTEVPVSGTSTTLSPLTEGQAYQAYIVKDCGGGIKSAPVGPVSFTPSSTVTYTDGNISTMHVASPTTSTVSNCPGTLTIVVPEGKRIASLTTEYTMTATEWKSEQRSYLYSPTLSVGESQIFSGTGNSAGIQSYSRSVPFLNGATGTITVELRAFRTYSSGGSGTCNITDNYVTNNSWKLIPVFEDLPNCIEPTGLVLQPTLSFTGANVSWNASVSDPDGYEYAVTTSATAPESGTLVAGTSASVSSGLTPGATYYLHVRSKCGGDFSEWSTSSAVFFGYCTPATTGTYYFTNVTTTNGATNFSNVKTSRVAGGYGDYTQTHTVSQIQGGEINISLTMNSSTHYFYIWIDLNNDGDFTDAGEKIIDTSSGYLGAYSGVIAIPSDLALGDYRVRIGSSWSGVINPCGSAQGEYHDYTLTVLAPPACMYATALTATNITNYSADLSWTSAGTAFDIKWGATGFDVETEGTLVTGFDNGDTLSGLADATAYSYYVRQDCTATEDGFSDWSGPFNFTTMTTCVVPDAPTGITFISVTTTGTTVNYTAPGEAPTGYVVVRSTSNIPPVLDNGTVYTTSSTTANSSLSGENDYFVIYNNTGVSTTASSLTSNTQYYYYVYSRFGTAVTSCYGGPVYSVAPLTGTQATAPATPTAFTITDLGFTSATVGWTASAAGGGLPLNYTVEVATDSGFTNQIAGSPFDAGTNVSYNVTGLAQSATYYVRVKSNNGSADSAYLSGNFATVQPGQVGSGTTAANNFPVSSSTAFNYTQQIYTKDQIMTNLEEGENYITKIKFYYNGTGSSVGAGSSTTTTNFENWTIYLGNTNQADFGTTTAWVPVGNMEESFSGTVTFPAPGNWMEIILDTPFQWDGDSNIVVAVDENSTSTGSSVYFRSFTSAANTGMYVRGANNIDPAAPGTATGRVATLAQIVFDAIETPDCEPVTSLSANNITPYTVDLSWSATELSFEVIYGAPGFNPQNEGTLVDNVTDNPFTLTGLAAETNYQFYVRQICGGDESPWAGPVAFTTAIACHPVTALTAGTITYNSAVLSWTSAGTSFDIEWGETGFTPTGNPTSASTTAVANDFILSGLTPTTGYQFYVRQNCTASNDGTSTWTGPFAFTTECQPPLITGATGDTLCGQGEATLAVTTDGDVVSWYTQATGGTKVGEGTTFNTPVITETTSYYAETGFFIPGVIGQVGTAATTSTTVGYSPYYHAWGGVKTQYIYTAEELTAAGLVAGEITSVAFEATTSGSVLNSFTVYIGATEQTTATTTHIGGLTLVYSANQAITVGMNTYNFTTPFVWNGSSSIVIQTSYSNVNGGGTSSSARYSNAGVNRTTYSYADNQSAAAILANMTGTATTFRANTYFNGMGICSSARTEVVATVTPSPDFALSGATTAICEGATSNVVTVATGAGEYDTFEWSPNTGVSGSAGAGWTFNPAETTVYTLTVSQSAGVCAASAEYTVTVNSLIDVDDIEGEVCVGQVLELNSGISSDSPIVIGAGALTSVASTTGATLGPNPLQVYYGNTKQQWVYTADELTSNGFLAGTSINSFAIELAAAGNNAINNLVVKMKNSSITAFATTSSWESGMTVVKAASSHTAVVGANTFVLDTPFVWDGSSSLVIEVNYQNNNSGTGSNTTARYDNTSFASTLFYRYDSTSQNADTYTGAANFMMNARNKVSFNITSPVSSVVWSPVANLYTDEEATIPYVADAHSSIVYYKGEESGTDSYVLTVTATSGCESTASVEVTVTAPPAAPTGESPQIVDEVTLADLEVTGDNLTWYSDVALENEIPDATVVQHNTTYYVTQTTGICESSALAVTVELSCLGGWTGTIDNDWNNAGNWCGGEIPTAATDVVINSGSTNYPVISGDIEVASITVEDGASITINGSLTTGDITVANGGNFVVSNGASLMQSEDAVNTGDISVHRNSNPMFRLDYTLWSSPVAGQNLQAFSPATLPTRIYKYDAVNDAYDNTYSESTFLAGQGYLFRSPNNWVINDGTNTAQAYAGVFTGVANNADIPVTVVSNSFNGLGNPYPSAIDAEELFAANSTIQAIYFWTNANAPVEGVYLANNWASWTTTGGTSADGSIIEPNGEIAVGQGFIAQVNGNTSVTFNNDMRIGGAGMFFRAMQDERHRLWLNLVSNNLTLNQILIGYVSGATQGEDNQIDGEMFGYGESALYSLINNSDKQFVIQGRSLPFEATDVVPLGFRATTAGEFTISLANFDGLFAENQNIYLKDNVTLAVHNLKEGAYSFISEEGTFDTRFEVVYQTTMSVETPDLNNNWIVFKQGDQFQILTQGFDMKAVQVFDMLGRTVYNSEAEGTTHTIARIDANQVLIVKVTTADGEVLTKKVQN